MTLIKGEFEADSCDGSRQANRRCCAGAWAGMRRERLTAEAMCENKTTGGWSDPTPGCQNELALGNSSETRRREGGGKMAAFKSVTLHGCGWDGRGFLHLEQDFTTPGL